MLKENPSSATTETTANKRCGGPDDVRLGSDSTENTTKETLPNTPRGNGLDCARNAGESDKSNVPEQLPNTARGGVETTRG